MKKWKIYAIFIIATLAIGGISGLITMNSMDIYRELNQPSLAPPPWVFPIVWSILFVLMGIGAARVYIKTEEIPIIYIIQLAINFIWPIIFFNLQAYLFAFVWLLVLIVSVILMIIYFYRNDKAAGLLQIPYLLWTFFAAYLNFAIYLLNG